MIAPPARCRTHGDLVHWFRGIAATCDIALDFRPVRAPSTEDRLGFLEFGAVGLPGIHTRTGLSRELVEHEVTGFLADNIAADWLYWLDQLCRDPSLRSKVGASARQAVLDGHLMRHAAANLVGDMRRLIAAARLDDGSAAQAPAGVPARSEESLAVEH